MQRIRRALSRIGTVLRRKKLEERDPKKRKSAGEKAGIQQQRREKCSWLISKYSPGTSSYAKNFIFRFEPSEYANKSGKGGSDFHIDLDTSMHEAPVSVALFASRSM